MVQRCVVVVVAACALLPASAQARGGAQALADRAMQQTMAEPSCNGTEPPISQPTDAEPPAAVLRRYGIFREPQPAAVDIWPMVFDGQGGRFASRYVRGRVVAGVQITVAPLLDWRPSVWPQSCDARLLTVARSLSAGKPADVRRGAERAARRIVASNVATRKLPARTLLGLSVPGGIAVTGALTLTRQVGLFTRVEFPPSRSRTTFAGLVPDGITRLAARSGATTVSATVTDNLVVLRLPHGATARRYEVFDTSTRIPRRLRHLTAG